MTFEQAVDKLPDDVEWSCSFGNAGDEKCSVYFRDPRGGHYAIHKVSHYESWPHGKWEFRVV